MIAIKIITILQFPIFVMCILSCIECIENESKAFGFWIVLWLICAILKYAVC